MIKIGDRVRMILEKGWCLHKYGKVIKISEGSVTIRDSIGMDWTDSIKNCRGANHLKKRYVVK